MVNRKADPFLATLHEELDSLKVPDVETWTVVDRIRALARQRDVAQEGGGVGKWWLVILESDDVERTYCGARAVQADSADQARLAVLRGDRSFRAEAVFGPFDKEPEEAR